MQRITLSWNENLKGELGALLGMLLMVTAIQIAVMTVVMVAARNTMPVELVKILAIHLEMIQNRVQRAMAVEIV
jgi:hypothetical protein